MEVSNLKGMIKKKQIPDFLIFSGPEWAVQRIYIDQIALTLQLDRRYIDSIKDIYKGLKVKQLVNKGSLYVVRDDKDLMSDESIQRNLESGLLRSNKLILILSAVDKRTKFYKKYADQIIDFEPLDPSVLKKYIQKEIKLSSNHCDMLMEVCEYDYGRCLLEIDKIKKYVNYLGPAAMQDGVFEKFIQDGTIYQPPKDAIFDLVDAILDRDVNASFDLMSQSYAVGEATMVMLSVLYTNTKALLQVQSCQSKDIAKATGLSGWQIMNAKKHLHRYKIGELVHLLKLVRECEKGIKTGRIEDQYAMQYILVNVM